MPDAPNTLYYGNNLDILRRYVGDESVDLIYLDPPLDSNAEDNVLFAERDGTEAAAGAFHEAVGSGREGGGRVRCRDGVR